MAAEEPRICSKCKQQVILRLPPSPGGADTFDIGGDRWGGGGVARVGIFNLFFAAPVPPGVGCVSGRRAAGRPRVLGRLPAPLRPVARALNPSEATRGPRGAPHPHPAGRAGAPLPCQPQPPARTKWPPRPAEASGSRGRESGENGRQSHDVIRRPGRQSIPGWGQSRPAGLRVGPVAGGDLPAGLWGQTPRNGHAGGLPRGASRAPRARPEAWARRRRRASTLTRWPEVSTGARPGRSQAAERARRRGRWAGWEENRNFSLKVTPRQVGSGPGGRAAGERERESAVQTVGTRGSGSTRRGRRPASRRSPGRALSPLGSPASRPHFLDVPQGPASARLERPASCFFFPPVCPGGALEKAC